MGFITKQSILELYPVNSTYGLLSFSTRVDGKSLKQREASRQDRIALI